MRECRRVLSIEEIGETIVHDVFLSQPKDIEVEFAK